MKKLLTLMLTVLTAVCFAQVSVQITSMPKPIDESTSNWTNGFVITANTQKSLERCFLILTIKGPVNCGTLTPQSAPTFTLEANKPKVFSGQNAIALFGTNCVLTPGSYTLEATVYYLDKPIGTPASRQFVIKKEEPAAQVNLSINMPNPIDANTANWTNGFVVTATTKNPLDRCRLILTIKGKVNCGTLTPQSAPTFTLEANKPKPFAGPNAIALFGTNCVLEPGSYELIATLYYNDRPTGTASRPFEIRKEELANYQPPQAIAPTDGTVINEADAKKPVTFRWIPVTPKPKEPVTYKLRIYEVKQGQTATAVVKSAIPMHEKDIINQTQYVLPSLSQLNATKGSSFAWTVQALGVKGNPVGGNNGMSGVMLLTNSSCIITYSLQVTDSTCLGEMNGLLKYHIRLKSDYVSPTGNLNFTETESGLFATMPITPYSPYTILNPPILQQQDNYSQVRIYDFDILVPFGTNTVRIGIQGDDLDLSQYECKPSAWYDVKLLPCICTDCDSLIWDFNMSASKISNTKYKLTGNLGVNLPIYGVEFQLQSWTYSPSPVSCSPGVIMLEESGMILLPLTQINNTSAIIVFNENISGSGTNNNATKAVKLISTTPITNPVPVVLTVGLPGALPGLPFNCCGIKYVVCIKATVYYDAERCKTCSIFKCFGFTNE
jgi:hypothetical protein